jgi:oxalate decarboxylase/phosphoglucose isomerase-like protein (cupin superfamily)
VAKAYVSRLARQRGVRHEIAAPGGHVRIASTPQFPNLDRDRSGPGRGGSGALCEKIHGHPNADESQYYVSAKGGLTMFAAEASARTFDFLAGDVGYVPMSMRHFIENTGSTPLRSSNCSNPHASWACRSRSGCLDATPVGAGAYEP